MRPSSRSLLFGILVLAVLALPHSLSAAGRAPVPTRSSAVLTDMVSSLRVWLSLWMPKGVVKSGAWQTPSGYARDLAKAGSSMDPNGAASTTPVVPPTVPTPTIS